MSNTASELIAEYLKENPPSEADEVRANRDHSKSAMLTEIEKALENGGRIAGRLCYLLNCVQGGSNVTPNGDGLAGETLNTFASIHDLELSQLIAALREPNPELAVKALLNKY